VRIEKDDSSSCVFCCSETYDKKKKIKEVRENRICLINVSKEKGLEQKLKLSEQNEEA